MAENVQENNQRSRRVHKPYNANQNSKTPTPRRVNHHQNRPNRLLLHLKCLHLLLNAQLVSSS